MARDVVHPGLALANQDGCHREGQPVRISTFGLGNTADLSAIRGSHTGKITRKGYAAEADYGKMSRFD
jgi:hypothetical protein